MDCMGFLLSPADAYGVMTTDFEEGSNGAELEVSVLFDGCLAIESGTNSGFTYQIQDLSDDGLSDVYRFNGSLSAMTFDDEGLPPYEGEFPVTFTYDPMAEPTCTDITFNNVWMETLGLDGNGMAVNQDAPMTEGGYSGGTITATCGGKTLVCELSQSAEPVGTFNLDTIASALMVDSICTYP